jgi:hypothetical protein
MILLDWTKPASMVCSADGFEDMHLKLTFRSKSYCIGYRGLQIGQKGQ